MCLARNSHKTRISAGKRREIEKPSFVEDHPADRHYGASLVVTLGLKSQDLQDVFGFRIWVWGVGVRI